MLRRAGRESEQFVVRLPDGMRGKIKDRALANQRSMNSELVFLLQEVFQAEENASRSAGATVTGSRGLGNSDPVTAQTPR